MPFNAILKELAGRTEALGAIMIDADGESVAAESDVLDMPLLGAHQGIVLGAIRAAAAEADGGARGGNGVAVAAKTSTDTLGCTVISTSSSKTVLFPLKDGYCLVLVLEKATPTGRAIFECKRARRSLESEMG